MFAFTCSFHRRRSADRSSHHFFTFSNITFHMLCYVMNVAECELSLKNILVDKILFSIGGGKDGMGLDVGCNYI